MAGRRTENWTHEGVLSACDVLCLEATCPYATSVRYHLWASVRSQNPAWTQDGLFHYGAVGMWVCRRVTGFRSDNCAHAVYVTFAQMPIQMLQHNIRLLTLPYLVMNWWPFNRQCCFVLPSLITHMTSYFYMTGQNFGTTWCPRGLYVLVWKSGRLFLELRFPTLLNKLIQAKVHGFDSRHSYCIFQLI